MSELENFLKNMNELLRKTSWQYECVFNTTDIEKLLKIVGVLSEALKILKVAVNDKQPDIGATNFIGNALYEADKIASEL